MQKPPEGAVEMVTDKTFIKQFQKPPKFCNDLVFRLAV